MQGIKSPVHSQHAASHCSASSLRNHGPKDDFIDRVYSENFNWPRDLCLSALSVCQIIIFNFKDGFSALESIQIDRWLIQWLPSLIIDLSLC